MFGLFKKKDPVEALRDQYKKLQEEAFKFSKSDRMKADQKYAEAEDIMKKIEELSKS